MHYDICRRTPGRSKPGFCHFKAFVLHPTRNVAAAPFQDATSRGPMRLLLMGATGSPYFEQSKKDMLGFLGPSKTAGLIPAANLFDEESYFRAMDERLTHVIAPIVGRLVHVRWNSNFQHTLDTVDALIVPGGNTYVLLKRLKQSGLLDAVRERVQAGLPYIGSSAGANVAGPNILTTNDWNVVGLGDFEALGLVPFNINPHYVEQGAADAPHSETRSSRIREFHQIWTNPVVGIEEKAMINVSADKVSVLGGGRVKLFTRDGAQRWFEAGEDLVWETPPRRSRATKALI